ncbi:helix-turn-helix transcriptional regulator [uncultured Ornithinimicrobium sp.]|uniref:ArsR/SmtB family transcription factor n=1 Tax=uncultured Ornithinimicrobium sp. TaxID=259307 RepID=UPI002599BAAC|nr:helix-turn-helix domain-containing protein [uncultured Ornithinimicrobium sp.]
MDGATHISDPARIRALAHPLRLELLDHLRDAGEASATECAAQVGESVASCSFHLRILAKYGFLERAERRGKEKPWRIAREAANLNSRPDPDVPGSMHAVQELASLTVTREADRVSLFLAQAAEEPPEWVEASTIATSAFWATAEELAELSEQVQHLTDRFRGRTADPSARPDGARHARLLATLNPDPAPRQGA